MYSWVLWAMDCSQVFKDYGLPRRRKQPAQWPKDDQGSACPRKLGEAQEAGRTLGAKHGGSRKQEVGEGVWPPLGVQLLADPAPTNLVAWTWLLHWGSAVKLFGFMMENGPRN